MSNHYIIINIEAVKLAHTCSSYSQLFMCDAVSTLDYVCATSEPY